MAGFKLIESYLSSSSEDEENVLQLTTISSGTSNLNNDNKRQLPPPKSILSLKKIKYDDNECSEDDEYQHDGRIRSFAHERGNWATLVYIEYKPCEVLKEWMTSVRAQLPIENHINNEFHISLTRTLILKFHWIESFVQSLRVLCRRTTKFALELMNVKIYCNDEKTRTFMGIECQSLDPSFIDLTHSIDKLLGEYQLPPFYEDASHHISFLWSLGDKRFSLQPLIPSLQEELNEKLTQDLVKNYIKVPEIHCKIGNKIYMFPLT